MAPPTPKYRVLNKSKRNCNINRLPDLTMSEITKELFNNQFLSDVQFLVNDIPLYAHSLELMKRSTVFQKRLLPNMGESKLIVLQDVSYESFYTFLQFIYTDLCYVNNAENAIEILKLAIEYQVIRLENVLIDWLTRYSACLRLYDFCVMENYRIPYNRIKRKVADTLGRRLPLYSFLSIGAKTMEEILKFDYVDEETTEPAILDAVIRWQNKRKANNEILVGDRERFHKFLGLIRFPSMKLKEFASCQSKIGHLLTDIDYRTIFKLIIDRPIINNTKWISKRRFDFSWRFKWINPLVIEPDRFLTIFTVTQDVMFTGIWFGKINSLQEEKYQLLLEARHHETREIQKTHHFRLYNSTQFYCNINSFGDTIRLKPQYEYTLLIKFPNECKDSAYTLQCRKAGNEIIITDPSLSVQISNAGINIFELIFNQPS